MANANRLTRTGALNALTEVATSTEERLKAELVEQCARVAAVELTDPDGRYAYVPLDAGRLALDGDRTRGPWTSDQPRRQQARTRTPGHPSAPPPSAVTTLHCA